MKRSVGLSLAVSLIIGACVVAHAADVVSLNVVGYYNVSIESNSYTLISIPMQKIPAYRGAATANSATTVTDGNATWTPGQFNKAVVGQEANGASTFYLELSGTNSAFEGRHFTIASNDATVLYIDGVGLDADIGVNALASVKYKIVAYHRIRDIFGEPGQQILQGGASSGGADNILKWLGTGFAGPIYYKLSGANSNHWLRGATTIVDNETIDRDEGLFVYRRGTGLTNFVASGEVLGNKQDIIIDPGYNLIGSAAVVNKYIIDTDLNTKLQGGPSSAASDQVLEWIGAGYAGPVYWKTSGANSNHWVRGATTIVDSNLMFRADRAYFIKRLSGTGTDWVRPSPLQ